MMVWPWSLKEVTLCVILGDNDMDFAKHLSGWLVH
jgi:hypothetical protein